MLGARDGPRSSVSIVLHTVLLLAPVLLLVLPLLMRRYPGERALLASGAKRSQRGWARPRASAPRRHRALTVAVHGGRLIGRSLAVRPPPAALAALAGS